MIVLQWIIWAIALLIFISLLYGIRRDAKREMPVHIALLIQTILLLFSVVSFAFLPWSKFHLLWVIPGCFLLGWILSFVMLIPIIGYILRDICLIFAHIFLTGTEWELGGFPWEIATIGTIRTISRLKREKYNTIEDFEAAIKRHENQLFGIRLYNEGIKYLYSCDKNILNTTDYHFKNIMERGEKAISEAKELLERVKSGTEDIKVIKKFEFPPIQGPGLDEMTQRATLLVRAYKKLFPDRPRNIPLTAEENEKLREEAMKNFEI